MEAHEYDALPQKIKNVVDDFDEDRDQYMQCDRIQKKLRSMGWRSSYGLDGTIYGIKKLRPRIKIQKLNNEK